MCRFVLHENDAPLLFELQDPLRQCSELVPAQVELFEAMQLPQSGGQCAQTVPA